jgi:hypothetical protein
MDEMRKLWLSISRYFIWRSSAAPADQAKDMKNSHLPD